MDKNHTMKKTFFSLALMATVFSGSAQVGIGVTGSVNSSAKLQVDATNRGFLPPRVNLTGTSDVSTISTPATGLLVYNLATAGTSPSNVTHGFYYYDGTRWQRVINQQPDATVSFNSTNPNTGSPTFTPNTPRSTDYIYVGSDASQWTYNGTTYVTYTPPASTAWMLSGNTTDAGSNKSGSVFRTGSVTIGGQTTSPVTTVASSAQLEVISTTKGFLPPRMTTAQRDAITSPADGLIIYNTDNSRLEIRAGSAWLTLVTLTGTGALTFAAGGTNQNVTLTPSGTGNTVLNGNVGIGTASPNAKLDIRTSPTSISDPGAGYLGIGTTTVGAATAGAGAVRYSTESGAGLEFSNGSAWNRLTSAVVKSTVIASKIGNTSENFPHTTITDVTNWTELLDVNNNFDPTTGIFTAPRSGNYSFNFSYKFRAGSIDANSKIEAFMTCSNEAKRRKTATAFPASGTNAEPGAQISFVVNLIAGETLRPSLWHSLGTTKQLLGDDDFNNLSIVEL